MPEGNLQAISAAHDLALKEVKNWQAQLAELTTQLTVLRMKLQNRHGALKDFMMRKKHPEYPRNQIKLIEFICLQVIKTAFYRF
jgi:hypothetical protein